MSTTTPNFGWQVPTSTDLVKDGATAIETLGDAIDASLVDLKGGTTGQVLSKTTNADMDFTWVTPNDADAIQNTIVDAKGDLIAATAADTPARLASSGVNGQVLTVDTSTVTGLAWAAPAGGQLQMQDFTSSGSWTCPSGITRAQVIAIGGGGGGGGGRNNNTGGGGGGAGAFVNQIVTVVPGTSYTVTIGAGGTAGTAGGGTGGNGGQTSFGTLVYAGYGGGGAGGNATATGNAGGGTNGGSGGGDSYTGYNAGGGGGAGSPGFGNSYLGYQGSRGGAPGDARYGNFGGNATNNNNQIELLGGLGTQTVVGAVCGGGGGGGSSTSDAGGWGSAGGGNGGLNAAGANATANTGGGGGGGGGNNGGTNFAGGTGGSGRVIVIWIG